MADDHKLGPSSVGRVHTQPKRKGCSPVMLALICLLIAVVLVGILDVLPHRGHAQLRELSVMKGLEIAIRGYKTEYLRLPTFSDAFPTEDNPPYDTTQPEGKALLNVLLANVAKQNPRSIKFWEPPSLKSSGAGYSPESGLKDRKGLHGYRLILDYSGDGKITNPEWSEGKDDVPAQIESDVILYSAGADGDFDTWKDNVRSWR